MKSDNMNVNSIRPVIMGESSPPVLACIRSWGRRGMATGLINVATDTQGMLKSRYLGESVNLPPNLLYTEAGIQIVKSFLEQFQTTGLLCVSEKIACWINDNRERLTPHVAIWLPPNRIIRKILSKKNQLEIAEKVGFNILPTYFIRSTSKPLPKIDSAHFPLCLRPSEPGSIVPAFKVILVYSRDELQELIAGLREILQPIIAQPFRSLPNLVVHGARSLNGESVGVQGFLVERKFEGVTLTIRPLAIDDELRRKCIAFTDAYQLTGPYHFEFLYDQHADEVIFLEINNRLGGTTAKVFTCGYDEPVLALQSYEVPVTFEQLKLKDVTITSKRALLKYIYYCLRGWLTPLDYPEGSRRHQVVGALKGLFFYRDDVFAFDDLAGTWSMYAGTFRGLGRRKRKVVGDKNSGVSI